LRAFHLRKVRKRSLPRRSGRWQYARRAP
jgi:hypothetical protein